MLWIQYWVVGIKDGNKVLMESRGSDSVTTIDEIVNLQGCHRTAVERDSLHKRYHAYQLWMNETPLTNVTSLHGSNQ